MTRLIVPLLLLLVAACSASPQNNMSNIADIAEPVSAPLLPLVIHTKQGDHRFDVEVARTETEQEKGLMFRKSVDADGGMLFPMSPPRTASFWMKNTLIPLDMLFMHTDGTIAFIHANAVPYSREPASAGIPVAAVLELRGGRAAELGIAEGDSIRWGRCAAPAEKPAIDLDFCPAPAP